MLEGVRTTMYNPVNVPLFDLKIGDKLTPLLPMICFDRKDNSVNRRCGPVTFGRRLQIQKS